MNMKNEQGIYKVGKKGTTTKEQKIKQVDFVRRMGKREQGFHRPKYPMLIWNADVESF